MGKRATTLVNWLFPDTVAERAARKDTGEKVARFRDAVVRDFATRKAQGSSAKFDAPSLDEALRRAAETAFKPVDERKQARVRENLKTACRSALTMKNIAALAAVSYGAYQIGKRAVPAARKAMLRVRAYMRSDAKNRAIPVRAHWKRAWRRGAIEESETAFGNMLRATVDPAGRAVRRAKRIVSRYTNPYRRG